MEYWEVTKDRALKTLPVWTAHVPDLRIGVLGPEELEEFIDGFEGLVQTRTAKQDTFDEAFRAVQTSLLKMKILGTKVPQIIEGQLDENEGIMKDVNDLFAVHPRVEATILKRARMLYPVWLRANAALAALTPTQAPITRVIQGVPHTVVMLKALLDGYTDLIKVMEDREEELDGARNALRAHDHGCDQLNKRWYKVVKASHDPGSPVYEALEGIPTEPSTPPPEPVEIATVTQGGEEGRQALYSYVPGGGTGATTKLLEWMFEGETPEWSHSVPLDASGNATGPHAVGTVLHARTKVSNSAGTRTSAPRTITIEEPIE